MEDEQFQLMWILFVALLAHLANCLCPSHCVCDDTSLNVSCKEANLEVVPIQLNPAIQILSLSKNKIANIHFTLSNYPNLIELDLSKNYIENLGVLNFESQYNLKLLNLSSNVVHKLVKDSFKGLKSLINLDMSNNNLRQLSAVAFKDLHNLITLQLSSNHIDYLEAGMLKYMLKLENLYLNDNQLLQIPTSAIYEGCRLKYLSLSQNLIEYIEDDAMPLLPDLRVFLLNTNVINYISASALSKLESLEVLDLSDNNLTFVPTDSLSKLSNLTKLDLSGNFIQVIPAVAFRGLFQLKFLQLDRLEILTSIDVRAFVDNINLEKINLNNNIAFKVLPINVFHGNPKIKDVSLTNNQIVTLDISHFPLDDLKHLKIGGNPLHCNCSLYWLWKLLKEQQFIESSNLTNKDELKIDYEKIICAGPEYVAFNLLVDVNESQITCSYQWVSILSISFSVLLIFITAVVLFYFFVTKRCLSKNEMQQKTTESSGNHYNNVPCQDNIQKSKCDLYFGEVDDTWSLNPNIIQVSSR